MRLNAKSVSVVDFSFPLQKAKVSRYSVVIIVVVIVIVCCCIVDRLLRPTDVTGDGAGAL